MYLLVENQYIWPVLALFVFLGLFLGAAIWAMRIDTDLIRRWQRLPLADDCPADHFKG